MANNIIKMLFIDAFVFYNELELLEYRLETLNPYVDWFVLVESTYTHNGEPKNLYFESNKTRFSKFLHKLIHVVVDDFPHKTIVSDGRQWENEAFQREQGIPRGLQQIPDINADDYVICSDLDEIINPLVIGDIRTGNITGERYTLEMDMYYYNLTNYYGKWHACSVMKVCSAMVNSGRWSWSPLILNGGWHLSYFGDPAFIQNKLMHFGHQEYNNAEFTSVENIKNAIANGTDLFKRQNVDIQKIQICDNTNLPPRMDLLVRFWESK
jgi:beta-1,4-mannosyl-glycoprotein beta-1,4-N-acetylglucosaminyltransferase